MFEGKDYFQNILPKGGVTPVLLALEAKKSKEMLWKTSDSTACLASCPMQQSPPASLDSWETVGISLLEFPSKTED